eukprot:s8214_g3.t1
MLQVLLAAPKLGVVFDLVMRLVDSCLGSFHHLGSRRAWLSNRHARRQHHRHRDILQHYRPYDHHHIITNNIIFFINTTT